MDSLKDKPRRGDKARFLVLGGTQLETIREWQESAKAWLDAAGNAVSEAFAVDQYIHFGYEAATIGVDLGDYTKNFGTYRDTGDLPDVPAGWKVSKSKSGQNGGRAVINTRTAEGRNIAASIDQHKPVDGWTLTETILPGYDSFIGTVGFHTLQPDGPWVVVVKEPDPCGQYSGIVTPPGLLRLTDDQYHAMVADAAGETAPGVPRAAELNIDLLVAHHLPISQALNGQPRLPGSAFTMEQAIRYLDDVSGHVARLRDLLGYEDVWTLDEEDDRLYEPAADLPGGDDRIWNPAAASATPYDLRFDAQVLAAAIMESAVLLGYAVAGRELTTQQGRVQAIIGEAKSTAWSVHHAEKDRAAQVAQTAQAGK